MSDASALPLVAPGVAAAADAVRARFTSARPFAHCVIDGFFDDAFANALLREFPAFARGDHRNEHGEAGGKSVVERIRGLGDAWRALDDCVQSPAFLDLVGRMTGIPGLLYDRDYFGGGSHDNRDRQSLDVHVDFNHHPATGWHRRLNLIVYLNHAWQADWGGALELHRDPRDPANNEVASVLPLFNRCVIFETTEHSWHGFPEIHLPAGRSDLSRKSVALYFYTRERHADQTAPRHSTVYVDRPLPAHLQPGHVLDADDVAALHELLARRDQHNLRLYRELEGLQARLDQSTIGRLAGLARRAAGRLRHTRG
ncbi:2OG-Fe(II) oxygenase [Luteimonas sp. MC1782]|uniref:2OG-Fe(II) oxygenase n=1 Tax=Luteimonas sp. MC1782 TaxID=2760305 RepID=UPI0016009394|nr:2OG-Fe(II) oxygenase [Luteimonas sp. MC1782]